MSRQNTITADRTVSVGELARTFAELAEHLNAIEVIQLCIEHNSAEVIPDSDAKIYTGLSDAMYIVIKSAQQIVAPFNVKMEG